ncbi:MAG: NTP transferase domain-containing protein [Acidimicrobiales bacterium]
MQLVVLAAGHGRRFGGLKQLASVGPRGEALMDFTARDALAAGFGGVILVVREEIQDELLDHIGSFWPADLPVEPVIQGAIAGTAQAVESARPFIDGPFGVANADDLYGAPAIVTLADQLRRRTPGEHVLVGYRLRDTVITDDPVTRGICETLDDALLSRIVEQQVRRLPDGTFEGSPIAGSNAGHLPRLSGEERVSMNLWGFAESMLDEIDDALDGFEPASAPHDEAKPPELLLPDVVGRVVAEGRARIRVVPSHSRCIGLTHPGDVPLVRSLVAEELAG